MFIFKIVSRFILIVILLSVGFVLFFTLGKAPEKEMEFGVSFSQLFAGQLGLDWQEAYLAILSDLGVKKLRLIAYWPLVESKNNEYDFRDLDWQINEAAKKQAEVILAIGQKLPRWPECHIPDWAKGLTQEERQTRILVLIEMIIKRYQGFDAIKYWQVENEPFLRGFGDCGNIDKAFLDREIDLVKTLDSRPIILTTSGELSLWSESAKRTRILGTTLYRDVFSRLGRVRYPILPVFYYRRAQIVKLLWGVDKVIIIELQAEPWNQKQIYETPLDEQLKSMNLEKFKEIIGYTRQTGLDEAYFWGAEWWYWLKDTQRDSRIWEEARELFK